MSIDRIDTKKTFSLFLLIPAFFTVAAMLLPYPTNAAEPLKGSPDVTLRVLTTELKPAVYLSEGRTTFYGESAPLVLFADVASLSLLYSARAEFASVELIQLKLSSASDENAVIDMGRLSAFPALEYIVFVYEYPACGNSESSDCLASKTSAAVINQPADSEVRVFYHLSIPQ